MSTPKISVIVPVYNVEQYLPRCIDSILAQTFTDFELLLIDDGSKDRSGEICEENKKKDSRIRVFHKENGGVSSARNIGLDKSKSAFLTFVDADDILIENALTDLYKCILNNKVDFVLGNCYKRENLNLYPLITNTSATFTKKITNHISHYALWGYLFKNSIIREHNIRFNEELAYSEDRIFIYQYVGYSRSMATCENYTYQYRINPNSACFSLDIMKKVKSQLKAIEQMRLLEKEFSKPLSNKIKKEEKDILLLGLRELMRYKFGIKEYVQIAKYFLHIKDNTPIDFCLFFYYSIKVLISKKLKSWKK